MEIYKILKEQGTVKVTKLTEKFAVSSMTIRRDLAIFEKQGLITTTYGGAYLNKGTAIEPDFYLKEGQNIEVKGKMGELAAELIEEGDSVIIDCGTTTAEVAKNLTRLKNLTVITNSLVVINLLSNSSNVDLIAAPGKYNNKAMGFISFFTAEFFQHFYVDKAFIGAQGVDLEKGITVATDEEAYIKKAICNSAKQRILMADSSKIGDIYLAKFMDIQDITHFVTDDEVDERYLELFNRKGIQLINKNTIKCEER